jgi:hypothetical protein
MPNQSGSRAVYYKSRIQRVRAFGDVIISKRRECPFVLGPMWSWGPLGSRTNCADRGKRALPLVLWYGSLFDSDVLDI